MPCFNPAPDSSIITNCDSLLGMPSFCIGNPVTILVRCNCLIVLAIAQVNQLRIALTDVDKLPAYCLTDSTARIDSQILHLVPATLDNDLTQVHDWSWSLNMGALCKNVPDQYVHSINPSVSVQNPGKLMFLFESTFLVTLSCSLFQELRPQDQKNILVVKQSDHFLYQNSGVSKSLSLSFSRS